MGVYGVGTGGAAALVAAAWRPAIVGTVVTRGGRADLARPILHKVRAPSLLCIGGRDLDLAHQSRDCLRLLPPQSRMLLIPGASTCLDEPGSIATLGRAASTWFFRHLPPAPVFRAKAPEGR